MSDVEIRVCPLGPPKASGPISYAWCSECQRVRKSNKHCPMVKAEPEAKP
jgi:hypothetical protein